MIKIAFLINSLGGGGAERVLVNLVNNMDRSVFDITIITMFDDGVNAELLNCEIHYISKKAWCPSGITHIYKFIPSTLLYKYFMKADEYDIVVAFLQGIPAKVLAGCRNSEIKKIVWIHNSHPESPSFTNCWMFKKSAAKSYSEFDKVVGVSENVIKVFSDYFEIKKNISVVYNTNDCERIKSYSDKSSKTKKDDQLKIISVGRLIELKGFERLFKICLRLKNEGYDFCVEIVGDGYQKNMLQNLISENNAQNWFRLTGFQSNPYKFVANADIFVCSSYEEGLSTAVSEAVILGKPVVSTDVSGAKEILGYYNEYGIVTENTEEALYEGLKKMISDKELRAYYAEKAKERAAFFDTATTVKQAENLFKEVLKGR